MHVEITPGDSGQDPLIFNVLTPDSATAETNNGYVTVPEDGFETDGTWSVMAAQKTTLGYTPIDDYCVDGSSGDVISEQDDNSSTTAGVIKLDNLESKEVMCTIEFKVEDTTPTTNATTPVSVKGTQVTNSSVASASQLPFTGSASMFLASLAIILIVGGYALNFTMKALSKRKAHIY